MDEDHCSSRQPWPVRLNAFAVRLLRLFLVIAAWITVVYVLWTSRLLRPVADDYALAVFATEGPVSGIIYAWRSYSGFVTQQSAMNFLVGMPLNVWPWELSSTVAFIVSSLAVVVATLVVIRPSLAKTGLRRCNYGRLLGVIPLLLISWWAFWWAPSLTTKPTPFDLPDAYAVTMWQTVNAQYVFTTSALVALWVYLWRRRMLGIRTDLIAALILGLLSGLNGPTFAVACLAFLSLILIAGFLFGLSFRPSEISLWALSTFGVGFGLILSLVSPGSRERSGMLEIATLDGNLVYAATAEALPQGVTEWFKTVASLGGLLALLIGLLIAYLLRISWTNGTCAVLRTGAALAAFSLVLSITSKLGELFAYEAFWHFLGSKTVTYLAIVAIGSATGASLRHHARRPELLLGLAFICFFAFVLTLSTTAVMTVEIKARHVAWETGPAPLGTIGDIETPLWRDFYIELGSVRPAPARGLGSVTTEQ